jgi:hypothetical protein
LTRSARALRILLAAGFAAACDPQGSSADRAGGARPPALPDTASEPLVDVPTVYGTHFLLLSTEGATPVGLALHLVARAEPARLLRDHRGWLWRGTEWTPVAWDRVEEAPTRRPWRIFPASNLKLIVGEQGEVTELIARSTGGRVTLRPGPVLDRWEDADAARRQIRQAMLQLAGAPLPAILLEEQVARPRASIPPPFRGHDSAVLRLGGGDFLILSHTRDPEGYGRSFAWSSLGGVQRRWDRVEIQALERMNDTTVGRVVPVRWQITIPEPGITGELTAQSSRAAPYSDAPASPVHLAYRVSGWIEADGRRRDAAGLLEHGEP